jgi:hypothetical protein
MGLVQSLALNKRSASSDQDGPWSVALRLFVDLVGSCVYSPLCGLFLKIRQWPGPRQTLGPWKQEGSSSTCLDVGQGCPNLEKYATTRSPSWNPACCSTATEFLSKPVSRKFIRACACKNLIEDFLSMKFIHFHVRKSYDSVRRYSHAHATHSLPKQALSLSLTLSSRLLAAPDLF